MITFRTILIFICMLAMHNYTNTNQPDTDNSEDLAIIVFDQSLADTLLKIRTLIEPALNWEAFSDLCNALERKTYISYEAMTAGLDQAMDALHKLTTQIPENIFNKALGQLYLAKSNLVRQADKTETNMSITRGRKCSRPKCCVQVCQIPAGQPGPKGNPGAPGQAGTPGATGATGETGATGASFESVSLPPDCCSAIRIAWGSIIEDNNVVTSTGCGFELAIPDVNGTTIIQLTPPLAPPVSISAGIGATQISDNGQIVSIVRNTFAPTYFRAIGCAS